MSLIEAVTERINALVPELKGAIESIVDLAALIDEGVLPQRDVCAFVVPLGFDARGGNSAAGAHTQMLLDTVGVIICIKSQGDAKARRALPKLEVLIDKVTRAIAGWSPANVGGAFEVSRGRVVSAEKGLVIYQLDFAVLDQLRIIE